MNCPKVSILMACYNGSRFIERSFDAILSQTWPNIELIFVDDGSTDDSFDVALSYKEQFISHGYSLVIIRQKQQGFCAAVVAAAQVAKGELLQILDVDDYIMQDSCRMQAEYLIKNTEYDVVRTNGYIVQENDLDATNRPLVLSNEDKSPHNIFMDLLTGKTNNWAGSYMIRADKYREFYSDKEVPISPYGQNLQFLLPLTQYKKAGFIDMPLFKYIQHIGSHSNQPSYDKQLENLNGYWSIRRQMLALLKIDDSDVIIPCEIAYHKRVIEIALEFNKMDDYHKSYEMIKRLCGLTLELRVQNAIIHKHISQYPYRLALTIKRLISSYTQKLS